MSDSPAGDHGPAGRPGPSESGGRFSDRRVLPLISERGDRTVVLEWLDTRYDTVAPEAGEAALAAGEVDCVIVDRPAFERRRDRLLEAKAAQSPRLLPFLLVHPGADPPADPGLREHVEEVIATPVRTERLAWRVDSLLRMRELSLELDRQRGQLQRLAEAAAHDLRNPLNVAKMYLPDVEDEDAVAHVAPALDRMEKLIDNVLSMARTTAGNDDPDTAPVQLGSVVRDCWDLVPKSDATLSCDLEGVTVLAQPVLVEQLVDNLLRNAIVHGPDDVTVRVGTLDPRDGFYVADDGPGIPPADRAAVFESGYSTGSGSGLGLRVVERVCDVHGWDVTIEDSAAGGTRFAFSGVEIF